MNILVVNTGSSSLKYQLFDMDTTVSMAGGVVERIGEEQGVLNHKDFSKGREEKTRLEQKIEDHREAMHLAASLITHNIDAVGHRVVQGGEAFKEAVIIDQAVKEAVRENNSLAPLHNPPNLIGIEVAEDLFPGKPQVAVFDTNFHQTLPEKAFLYGLPYEYYQKYKIRKYGFHGTSHKYVAGRAAELMEKPAREINLITLHLGNGCSISAVKGGRCVDTSMGMTPLAGVMMGTRTGDLDPAIFGYLMDHTGMSQKEMDEVLNKKSGLKGICGHNDLRDIHALAQKGDRLAILAVDMFAYQIKKYIGSSAAALGRVDGLVFTAGIGENDDIVRARILEELDFLGIDLDEEKNKIRSGQARAIHKDISRVQIWVVPTNEELQIAMETCEVLER
ncbi:acetate/propionate family kinase [Desulfospira joergensenii]|uniref:acetate/propionate family kinase n=1 Tax=Desulfospira joergensenii TaxID=53329 RepID=UPI000486E944|nr:acetate kinase [Desulfospira joergensenii]